MIDREDESPNVRSRLAPGTRIALDLPPRAKFGIPLPDGTALPALNGAVRVGPFQRPAERGPLPSVVGVLVDENGFEWYEHSDGSMTTSRWVWLADKKRWEARSFHAIPPAR